MRPDTYQGNTADHFFGGLILDSAVLVLEEDVGHLVLGA